MNILCIEKIQNQLVNYLRHIYVNQKYFWNYIPTMNY